MNKFGISNNKYGNHLHPLPAQEKTHQTHQESTLRSEAERALCRYFQHIEDEPVTDLHQIVMAEVAAPLLETVMRYCGKTIKAGHLSC